MKTKLIIYFVFPSLFWVHNNLFSQDITAKNNLHVVDSMKNTINPNAKLNWITSDSVSINGSSLSWSYAYGSFSNDIHTNYYFHTTQDSVVYDSLNHFAPVGIMYIDTSWIDSDSALVLAESEGGSDFRNNHNGIKIVANLGKPLVPNNTNRWYIWYISLDDPSDRLFINLDASDDPISNLEMGQILNDFQLYQNYPNPFNPTTKINYQLSKSDYIKILVYDILGNEVETLVDEHKRAGSYEIEFNGSSLSSGLYIYRLVSSTYTESKKMLLLK